MQKNVEIGVVRQLAYFKKLISIDHDFACQYVMQLNYGNMSYLYLMSRRLALMKRAKLSEPVLSIFLCKIYV